MEVSYDDQSNASDLPCFHISGHLHTTGKHMEASGFTIAIEG